MFSRTVIGSLLLLSLVLYLLVNGVTLSAASPLQLVAPPPPIISPEARFGPVIGEPSEVLTATVTATATPGLTALPTIANVAISETTAASSPIVEPVTITETTTPTATPTVRRVGVIGLKRPPEVFLPTVTPTPTVTPLPLLLPTETPRHTGTPVGIVTSSEIEIATETASAIPSATAPEVESEIVPEPSSAPLTETMMALPSPIATASAAMPVSYQAQGSFSSQTVFTDSMITQQWGNFTILQSAALNAYGANQHYSLSTQLAAGDKDEVNVYQIDDYIAVNYTGGDWMLVRRDQGSNIVRAIQPITDLAVLFPRILDQAEFIGQEKVAGVSAMHYRIDDPDGPGARLIQPLLALTGQVRSLKLEVWIAVPGGFVVSYNFQVGLANARVLDSANNEVRADQTVVWTYQLTPSDTAQAIEWPADAPSPKLIPVPGFDPGAFPMPPNTQLLSLAEGTPDLISQLTPVALDSFFRSELYKLGWDVEGEDGLLRCSKEGVSFQLLITEDAGAGGTRVTILSGE